MTARAGVLVLLALALYFALTRLWPDDERRIRDTLDELAAVVSAPAGDGIALVTRAAQLGSFFADDVVIDLGRPFNPIHGRETIVGLAARMQIPGEGLDVRFVDVTVDLLPGGDVAVVRLTATVRAHGQSVLDRTLDAKELEMRLRKVGGDWTIDEVLGVETIERVR